MSSSDFAYDDPLVSIQWEDQEASHGKTSKELVACNSQHVYIWDVQANSLKEIIKCADIGGVGTEQGVDCLNQCKSVKRDPHNSNMLAFSYGKRFELVDMRTKAKSTGERALHQHSTQMILDLDYNPIKVHTLATVGQDSTIRFWDLRKIDSGLCVQSYNPTDVMTSSQASRTMADPSLHVDGKISMTSSNRNSTSGSGMFSGVGGANTLYTQQYQCHWINKIRYNQSHDQLLLTCDTATFMNLYKFSSVSSAPQIQMSTSNIFGLAPSTAEDLQNHSANEDHFAFDHGNQTQGAQV